MPVISLIHDLFQTGDRVQRIEGVFSAALSYITSTLASNPGMVLSEALASAQAKLLTEADPYDDLSGIDTARKALIVARECGLQLEMSDVKIESLLPPGVEAVTGENKAKMDADFSTRMSAAAERGERLCYIGEVDIELGSVSVGLRSISMEHPLASVKEAEFMVSFTTGRYPKAAPLVVRGPAPGPVAAASGVFADLLRLSKTLGR